MLELYDLGRFLSISCNKSLPLRCWSQKGKYRGVQNLRSLGEGAGKSIGDGFCVPAPKPFAYSVHVAIHVGYQLGPH
jgi:hypothetical protein